MTTFETMLLLSTAILVSGLTAAAADPLKDDLDAIRNEFCEGEPFKECLAKFRADMASKQGYQEAALQVCPRMVVTDPQRRDLRNKKYRSSPDFDRGYQYVITHYAKRDFLGHEFLCDFATGDTPLHPKAYQKSWLKIEWTDADREPLVSKEALAERVQAFQNGYHNARCKDPCEVREGSLADPVYAAGWDAGRIDHRRTQR